MIGDLIVFDNVLSSQNEQSYYSICQINIRQSFGGSSDGSHYAVNLFVVAPVLIHLFFLAIL